MKQLFLALAGTLLLAAVMLPQSQVRADGPATVAASIPVGEHPKGVAVDGASNHAYVALFDSSELVQVDTATNAAGIRLSTHADHANQVVYQSSTGRVFVTNRDSNNVSFFDTDPTFAYGAAVPAGKLAWGIAAGDPNVVLVSNFGSSNLSHVNVTLPDQAVTYHVPFGGTSADRPSLAAYDAHNQRYYALGWDTGNVYIVYPAPRFDQQLNIGMGAFGVAVDPSNGFVYLTNRLTGKVYEANCSGTFQLTCNMTEFAQLPTAYAAAVNPSTRHLLISQWKPGDPVWSGTLDGRPIWAQVRPVLNGFDLSHHGVEARAYVYTEREAAAAHLLPAKRVVDSGKAVRCPMPGLVVSIAVGEGQEIKAGETLAVVEAMKMENVLRADRDGVVKKVHARTGDTLPVDAVILEFA